MCQIDGGLDVERVFAESSPGLRTKILCYLQLAVVQFNSMRRLVLQLTKRDQDFGQLVCASPAVVYIEIECH